MSNRKVASTQVVHCNLCYDEAVDALLIIFDDGIVEVRCAGDTKSCPYGRRVRYFVKIPEGVKLKIEEALSEPEETSKGVNKMGQGSREKLTKAARDTRPAIKRETKRGTIDKAGHRLRPAK